MSSLSADLGEGVAVVVSTVSDGDQREQRARLALLDRPFALLRQVHGADVVDAATAIDTEAEGDALVSSDGDAVLAVRAADCVLIALVGDNGAIAAAHAGWRGLLAGVVEAAVDALRARGATRVRAIVGPHIGPECYAFSPGDLAPIAARYGSGVVARTATGETALDLGAGVRVALAQREVDILGSLGGCGGCSGEFFSWRVRKDEARHLLGVYRT